jgi:glycosyltransferase involved in cell wall biosynthesis
VRTALIATVLNEADGIEEFLTSIEAQTRIPDSIVVTDGGSTDGTWDLLSKFAASTALPFQYLRVPGNRSMGRNTAIRESGADSIAVTDVDVLDPAWFERILAPIETGQADVVAGWYELLVETPRDRAVGLLTQYSLEEVNPERFLPSSRSVAFRRAAWERVGGYPEHLITTEDTAFDLALRKAGCRFVFEPNAVVKWRPAVSAGDAYRMYRQFAESDGEAGIFLWSYTKYGLLYGAYGAGILLLLSAFFIPTLSILLGVGIPIYLAFRIRKLFREGLFSEMLYGLLVVLALDIARLTGYLKGRWAGRKGPAISDLT